jgi:hypothetical protein
MADLTYTVQGTFNRDGKAVINVCIPAEPQRSAYRTEIYNLSKITSSGSINVIFCHFSDGRSVAIQHDTFDYRLNLDVYDLKNHPGATDFDENNEDAVFIFFHNEKFEQSDREIYFKNIEEIYQTLINDGNQSQDGSKTNAVLNNPRKVGMSLVTKLNISK